jgi:hypothetical protein
MNDPTNKFQVIPFGDGVAILRPPAAGEPVSVADALNLAAWLVRVAGTAGVSDVMAAFAAVEKV